MNEGTGEREGRDRDTTCARGSGICLNSSIESIEAHQCVGIIIGANGDNGVRFSIWIEREAEDCRIVSRQDRAVEVEIEGGIYIIGDAWACSRRGDIADKKGGEIVSWPTRNCHICARIGWIDVKCWAICECVGWGTNSESRGLNGAGCHGARCDR